MSYEDLIAEVTEKEIELFENNKIGKLKGLYVDNTITLNIDISTEKEKKCILAEELGHYHTSSGNILDQSKTENIKQENIARGWAFRRLVGVMDLINAYKSGVRNRYELAEYLNVTEEFIQEALGYYKQKYGLFVTIDSYTLYFEPLAVMEVWK